MVTMKHEARLLVRFCDVEDRKNFLRYVDKVHNTEGTVGGLWAGLACAALNRSWISLPATGADLERWESLQSQLCAALDTLRQCKAAVEDGSKTPSARLELVRDYAGSIIDAHNVDYASLLVHWRVEVCTAMRKAIAAQAPGVVGCSASHLWSEVVHHLYRAGSKINRADAEEIYRQEICKFPFDQFVYPDLRVRRHEPSELREYPDAENINDQKPQP